MPTWITSLFHGPVRYGLYLCPAHEKGKCEPLLFTAELPAPGPQEATARLGCGGDRMNSEFISSLESLKRSPTFSHVACAVDEFMLTGKNTVSYVNCLNKIFISISL